MTSFDFTEEFSAAKLKKEFAAKKREFTKNLPSIIAAIVIAVAVLASLAEFKFSNIKTPGFAANSTLFALLTYLTYILKKYIGKQRGKADRTYLEAKNKHESKCDELRQHMTSRNSLADFCAVWVTEEAERARRSILSGTGVTEEEWQTFSPLGSLCRYVLLRTKKLKKKLKKEKLSEAEYQLITELKAYPGEKKAAICRACMIEKQRLTPADIIYETATKAARERTPIRLQRVERKRDLTQILSITVMMTGVLAVIPEITSVSLSAMAILTALMKIVSLLWTGFNAEVSGETLYTVIAVENFEIQNTLIDEAIKWRMEDERREDGRAASVETDS